MQYYTRSFHMSLLPYDLLDEFTVHEEAEHYNEEFYQKLLEEKREQYRREDLSFKDGDIFSDFYTGAAVKFLSEVPPYVGVADYRVFLLKVMAPSVWKYFKEEEKKQEKRCKLLFDKLKKREQEDQLKMPKHWLPLFDLAWEDGAFFLNTVTADKITATVRDEFGYSDVVVHAFRKFRAVYPKHIFLFLQTECASIHLKSKWC